MKYSFSTDEEHYTGEYDSPEEAALVGFDENEDCETIYVGENFQPKLEDGINARSILEDITENREEFLGEHAEGWADGLLTEKAALSELTDKLSAVVKEWADRHDLQPDFWSIENVKTYTREQVGAPPIEEPK